MTRISEKTREAMRRANTIEALLAHGLGVDEYEALRRISMTLHRWHELECGDSNNYSSWAIERDGDEPDSKPYRVVHPHSGGKSTRYAIPDRETAALKRLAAIMARYPTLQTYVQGDPRGCALYVIRPGDVPDGHNIYCCYSRGIAIY